MTLFIITILCVGLFLIGIIIGVFISRYSASLDQRVRLRHELQRLNREAEKTAYKIAETAHSHASKRARYMRTKDNEIIRVSWQDYYRD
jgi:uncharacterized membrane-anchored protein YhcB (DUF1043 family)